MKNIGAYGKSWRRQNIGALKTLATANVGAGKVGGDAEELPYC